MDTPAPCAQWPTASSTSPAPCSATAPASTRTVQDMSQRERATHALDRHSPRLGESDDQTARGRCGHVVCGVSKSRCARLCVHGDGSVHAPSGHLTPTSIAVTTTQKGTCKMVGSPFHVATGSLSILPLPGALFVEAKAHIPETASPPSRASTASAALISRSLAEARHWYSPRASAPWDRLFYQYANRLAHHFFLRRVNRIDAALVFVYFVNADDVHGPKSELEWRVCGVSLMWTT